MQTRRFTFFDIFQKNSDGSLTPRRTININGVTFGPGVAFGAGVSFGGIDFFKFLHHDIAADDENGVLVIKGFYERQAA